MRGRNREREREREREGGEGGGNNAAVTLSVFSSRLSRVMICFKIRWNKMEERGKREEDNKSARVT